MEHLIKFKREDTGDIFELTSKIIDNKETSKNKIQLCQRVADAPLGLKIVPIEVIEQFETGTPAKNKVESVVVLKADTSKSMADFNEIHGKIAETREELAELLSEVTARTAEIKALIAEYKELKL